MYEEKTKMLSEMKKLKDELTAALNENAEMRENLMMAQDSLKQINIFKDKLADRDNKIQQLHKAIGDLKGDVHSASSIAQ